MNKDRIWALFGGLLPILVGLVLGVVFLAITVPMPKAVPYSPKVTEITTEAEETFTVATLTFTEEEAEEIIKRIQDERAEAERKEKARQAAARMARYSASYFKRAGRISWGGWSWTYYSERILPGHGLRIPGRHTDEQGYVRDGNGYLCLASDKLRRGTVIETPFGSYGKVYDCGCGMSTIDVYVGW